MSQVQGDEFPVFQERLSAGERKQLHDDLKEAKADITRRDQNIVSLLHSLYDLIVENENLKKELSRRKDMSNMCATWERKALQLEALNFKPEQITEGNHLSHEKLQENQDNCPQRALQESWVRFDVLEEHLAQRDALHHQELSEKHWTFKKELAEMAARLQRDFLEQEKILKKQLSEKDETQQKVVSDLKRMSEVCSSWERKARQLEEANKNLEHLHKRRDERLSVSAKKEEELLELQEEIIPPEEVVKDKEEKRGFWSHMFHFKKKAADSS
ncbi:golgin subfamily A member 6-like protein 25 [Brachionichthys hirsutus]|uniref:golgin subfamily A member 6-like protein 25 n=1 Tax=Brachionichthys hirsutus TaxID=412623 RepID=UPI003604FB96